MNGVNGPRLYVFFRFEPRESDEKQVPTITVVWSYHAEYDIRVAINIINDFGRV